MTFLKKIISVILCVLFIFSSFSAFYSYAVSGVYYERENGYLTITGNGAMDRLFTDDKTIVDVYIGKGITSVPDEAFSGCTNITTVMISNSVTSIGASAFDGCASLSELRLPSTLEAINENTFNGCSSLTNIKMPDKLRVIKSGAFANCTSLDYAIITLGVEEIESGAFDSCSSLSTVYYAVTEAQWDDVSVPEGCFGSAELISAAPVIDFNVTRSAGKAVVYATLVSGNFMSADIQVTKDGNASIGSFKKINSFSSAINLDTGTIALAALDNISAGSQILGISFTTGQCTEFSVNFEFLSCYVMIDSYTLETAVVATGENPIGRHIPESWTVAEYPTAESDGTAYGICEQCGEVTKALPCSFKNCDINETVVSFSDYALTPSEFKESFIIHEDSEVNPLSGGFVGTGSTVSVDYDGPVIDYRLALKGDADGDAYCDAQDSVIMMCISCGLLPEESVDDCVKTACDCQNDSLIDENDAVFAFNHGIGI